VAQSTVGWYLLQGVTVFLFQDPGLQGKRPNVDNRVGDLGVHPSLAWLDACPVISDHVRIIVSGLGLASDLSLYRLSLFPAYAKPFVVQVHQ